MEEEGISTIFFFSTKAFYVFFIEAKQDKEMMWKILQYILFHC
jgi:hypothetical protein